MNGASGDGIPLLYTSLYSLQGSQNIFISEGDRNTQPDTGKIDE